MTLPLPIVIGLPPSMVMQQEFLERSLNSLLSASGSRHIATSLKEELSSLQKKLYEKRHEEMSEFLKNLGLIMKSIRHLKQDISSEERIHERDISYFEDILLSIQESFIAIKQQLKERICALQEEEGELQTLISTLVQRTNLTSGTEGQPSTILPVQVRPQVSTKSAYDSMHPDIQEFQNFVQRTGGHTGGWTSADHLLFTKLLQKRRCSEDFVSYLLDQMPEKSKEDIDNHEIWYRQYLTRKEAHRKALADWKKSRTVQESGKEEEQRPSSHSEVAQMMADPERAQETKAKIAEWKRKQDEKRRLEEEIRITEKKKAEEKWKKKMAYFEKQRVLLLQRKKEIEESKTREERPVTMQTKELEEVQKRFTYLTLKDYREHDQEFMKRRRSRLEQQRRRRDSSVSVSLRPRSSSLSSGATAKRDPSRLLQPTAAWQMRLIRSRSESNNDRVSTSSPFFINHIPHLAVPDWRKGIT